MSNHDNHRRGEQRRSEHGPRYENPDPGKGCNATHVARGRKSWKRRLVRALRRKKKLENLDDIVDRAIDEIGRDEYGY